MSVFLPIHLSAWQAFLHNVFAQWCGPFVGIALGIISIFIWMDIDEHSVLVIPAILTLLLGCAILFSPLSLNDGPNPRDNTAYSDSSQTQTTNLYWDEWRSGLGGLSNNYYHDDYLKLKHTDVKIARGHWSNSGVRITPLNPTGRAWLIVARRVQNSPKPHVNIKIDTHLSYTKASVETPQGTKKYICYVKNIKPKVDKDYTVLKYKNN